MRLNAGLMQPSDRPGEPFLRIVNFTDVPTRPTAAP